MKRASSGHRKERRPFTADEDATLAEIVSQGVKGWGKVASYLPGRTARQCRERWIGYLDPNIKYEPWTENEDMLLIDLIQKNGHKWTLISKAFVGRTDNDVKNRWYTHLRGKCQFSSKSPEPRSKPIDWGSGEMSDAKTQPKKQLLPPITALDGSVPVQPLPQAFQTFKLRSVSAQPYAIYRP